MNFIAVFYRLIYPPRHKFLLRWINMLPPVLIPQPPLTFLIGKFKSVIYLMLNLNSAQIPYFI